MGIGAGSIATVLGAVAAGEVGLVLPHEHLVADLTTDVDAVPPFATARHTYERKLTLDLLGEVGLGARNRDNETLDEVGALSELKALPERSLVVDTTEPHEGRDPAALVRLARASGVHVVMSASGSRADDVIAQIETGVLGVRAGVIGLGTADPEVVEAAAEASVRTGAAVRVTAAADLDRLLGAGAAPSRVVRAHADSLVPVDGGLEALLDRGISVQFDGIGRIPSVYTRVADHEVAARIVHLARRGFGERILVSRGTDRKIDRVAYGGSGLGFIEAQFLPYVAMLGADPALGELLTRANPARVLALAPKELR